MNDKKDSDDDKETISKICCTRCSNLGVDIRDNVSEEVLYDENSLKKCQDWLENCSISDVSVISSDICNEISNASDSNVQENAHAITNRIIGCEQEEINDSIANFLTGTSNNYGKVLVENSENVHIGNLTYINGPIYLNQNVGEVNRETVINNVYINAQDEFKLNIRDRISWLAQPPREPTEYLKHPAKFVIISHTATEEASTIVENNLLVRLVQQFHIESKKWADIAYNFLIGADGNVYEGRGFNAIGAHTHKFNKCSIGISFIGCFMDKLPTQVAMLRLQPLIDYGVKIGAIANDYSLLGHCQCSAVESPGRVLYEELKSWKNWNPNVSIENYHEFLTN